MLRAQDMESRWSRACGSGIGLSSHKNEYVEGVNINNFLEDRQGTRDATVGHHILGAFGQFRGDTTSRVDYSSEGKYGQELLDAGQNLSAEGTDAGVGKEKLFHHGHPSDAPIDAQATLNSLTYGAKTHGEPQVHQYLWNDSKFNNYNVPVAAASTKLVSTAKQQWVDDDHADPYVTHSRRVAMSSALGAAASNPKRPAAMPQSEGGQPPSAGRVAKGPHVDICEAPHLKTDLRGKITARMPPKVQDTINAASARRGS